MLKNIIISSSEELDKAKKAISEGGTDKLHVIADFDRTLTSAFVDGKKVPSLISVLRDGDYLTPDYTEKAHALFDKYHVFENAQDVSLGERKVKMHEWWTTHFDLLIKSGLNRKDLENVVKSGKVKFREGALEFIDLLHANKIPLIVMSSSGLGGDTIAMYLDEQGRLYDNIHVISNSYKWDEKGNAVSVKKPIIHTLNKDETAIQDFPAFDIVKDRKNVILLGDSLGDVGMVKGFEHDNLIKIGFLNEEADEKRELYKGSFDIVILNDSDMKYINDLLAEIIRK